MADDSKSKSVSDPQARDYGIAHGKTGKREPGTEVVLDGDGGPTHLDPSPVAASPSQTGGHATPYSDGTYGPGDKAKSRVGLELAGKQSGGKLSGGLGAGGGQGEQGQQGSQKGISVGKLWPAPSPPPAEPVAPRASESSSGQPLLRGSGAQFNRIAGPYSPREVKDRLANKMNPEAVARHSNDDEQTRNRFDEIRGDWQRQPNAGGEGQLGRGPGEGGDRYRRIIENAYLESLTNPLSTFSIDVDTASYANVRQFIMQQGVLPPPDAVRIEEMLNYFRYDYAGPKDGRPFASHMEVADCPWEPKHKLVRVAIKGRDVSADKRPQANLVLLIDVSGSMNEPQKLPLLVRALKLLTEQLRNTDRVAIVVYAGSEGLVLNSTLGESRETILTALENLRAGGSTNGGAGINLAYKVAKENFIPGGINRVILCTDGDFNVGVTSDSSLERMVEEKAKEGTFLTVLGFGRGNFNDSMLEAISGKGNGNYAYVDNIIEARKVLVEQLSGTLLTIAKDVKIQIEFNPAKVAGYRLLGYEDRILAAEDFNNDKKDAGEIGSGHTVTALYEIIPAGAEVPATKVDELKYQKPKKVANDDEANELLTLKIRYKDPAADKSQLIEVAVQDEGKKFAAASSDFQFAAAVAGFGMLLRDSQYKGTLNYDAVLEIATQHKGEDLSGYRNELLEMVRKAKQIAESKK